MLLTEIYKAPQYLIDFYEHITAGREMMFELTNEAEKLADQYIKEKVVGKTSLNDCQHMAVATLSGANVLVSWNFKHIVNLQRIRGYNSVNFRQGYPMIEIRTPREVFDNEGNN